MSQTVTLSASNTTIPRIGYGTGTKWYSGDNSKPVDKDLVRSIQDALALGYRHLDAAEMYGTETSVGEALRTQSIPRKDIFITSKVFKNIENIERACTDVLSRLGIDYLDLWLIHAPFFDRNKISLERAWREMEKLVESGKVKAIGVSNFQKQHLEELFALNPKIKPAVNQSQCTSIDLPVGNAAFQLSSIRTSTRRRESWSTTAKRTAWLSKPMHRSVQSVTNRVDLSMK